MDKFHSAPFQPRKGAVVFTKSGAAAVLGKLARIKIKFVNFHHNVLGPEWSTNGPVQTDSRHHLHFLRAGRARLIHRGAVLEMSPGQAYWVPGHVSVGRQASEEFEEFILTFNCEMIDGIDIFRDWPERRPLAVGEWDMAVLVPEWTRPPLGINSLFRLESLLYGWMAEHFGDLDDLLARHAHHFIRYAPVLEFSAAHLGADLRVADLAGIHGASPQAFSTAFVRDFGLSPKAYLNQRLNQEARHLVADTDWTLKKIASQLRFSDEYYFSRFFSKMNGVSPQQYRRRLR